MVQSSLSCLYPACKNHSLQNHTHLGLLQYGFWMLFKQPFPEFLLLAHLHDLSYLLFKDVATEINILKFIMKQPYPG
jgi:hypothetical protein